MKVIHELVTYLRGRGMLTDEKMVELVKRGFVSPDAVWCPTCGKRLPELAEDGLGACTCGAPPSSAEPPWSEPAERLRAVGGRKGGGRDDDDALATRLAALHAEHPEVDRALSALAGRATGGPRFLRELEPEALVDLLDAALEVDDPPLPRLWEALSFDGYPAVVASLRTPAARAFEQLLDNPHAPDPRALWVRAQPEVAHALDVAAAQSALLAAHAPLLARSTRLLGRLLRKHPLPLAYWTLLVAYTALGLGEPSGPNERPSRALAELDDRGLRTRVFACALRIAPGAVTKLLGDLDDAPLASGLVCPPSWNR